MKVCFPVLSKEGMESKVYGHFGSAPAFIIVDTEGNAEAAVINKDRHHVHGMCNPVKALDNQQVDAIVVGGIGGGALRKLQEPGIKVFKSKASTVRENLDLIMKDKLDEVTQLHTCAGHGHGMGCGH
jgi:predicted Fe-Mo cluster-binding NifX family protein